MKDKLLFIHRSAFTVHHSLRVSPTSVANTFIKTLDAASPAKAVALSERSAQML